MRCKKKKKGKNAARATAVTSLLFVFAQYRRYMQFYMRLCTDKRAGVFTSNTNASSLYVKLNKCGASADI